MTKNEERSAIFKWMSRAVIALVCDAQAREREREAGGGLGVKNQNQQLLSSFQDWQDQSGYRRGTRGPDRHSSSHHLPYII